MTTRTHDATKEAALLAAAECVSAGGSNPTDDNGDCTLPREPLDADYEAMPEDDDREAFNAVYRNVMRNAHGAVDDGRDPRRHVARDQLHRAAAAHNPNPHLVAARIAMGWTQRELGQMLGLDDPGVAQNRIAEWERGAATPSDRYRDWLVDLAAGTDPTDLDDLLVGMKMGAWDGQWDDLPVFGEPEPADTSYPIWSWDGERVLVGEGEDLHIVQRDAVDAA